MKKNTLLIGVLVCALNTAAYAQDSLQLTSKDSIIISSKMAGLGYNFVDDSGDVFDGLFDTKEEWNAVAFPSRLSFGKYFKSGLGIEAMGTYNKYRVGKIIDAAINSRETTYYAIDTRLSYDLNKLIGQTAWFDPYVGAGLGFTEANDMSRGTYNAIAGFRIWFSDRWGIDLNSSGKWAMGDKGATNHLQHSAGVVYQFGIEKGLSKKGEEKLGQILALEQEKQRVQDSIATSNSLREEALLAERVAKEKEKSRLAAIEKSKINAENQRKAALENSIKELGYVYFGLNSSYLNEESKSVLEAMAQILEKESQVALKIVSHTDSRGASTYNQWLSDRRVQRTRDYLISKGISAERLTFEGVGEAQLLNECDDTTYCPEEKHKVNRRSEFIVTKI